MAVALVALPGAAHAARDDLAMLSAYAQARGATSASESAKGYAAMLALFPGDESLASGAWTQAMVAGDRPLALQAARSLVKASALSPDVRMLLLAEAVSTRDWTAAGQQVDRIGEDRIFAFAAPVLRAWIAVGSGEGDPLRLLSAGEEGNPLSAAYAEEHRPLILLALGRKAEGLAALTKVIRDGGARAQRLRIGTAALLVHQGDRSGALALLQGDDASIATARALVEKRKPVPGALDSAPAGIAEFMVRLALDLHRQNVTPLGLTFARLSTFLAPTNSETWLVTSELLAAMDQQDEALEVLAKVPAGDPFADTADDSRIRMLMATGAKDRALALAEAAVAKPAPSLADWTRLGDLYGGLDRLADAADAYGKAIARARAQGQTEWALHLLRGGTLEQLGRWEEAKEELETAYKLAPGQAIVLNYLGYAQLERRENIDEAMRLIAEASKLEPDSPEITDSLGWAHYLRGDVAAAIPLLERAVAGEPSDPAMNEHLGDAYYSAGRRYEARYAWEAALLSAEDKAAIRLRAKIGEGLTPKLASP
ncbi:tetratricopeptide repeat protein [Allosphingosinicella humi]